MEEILHTAKDLADLNPHLIKKQYNVILMRTVMELQGIVCAGLEEAEPKQSITSSKSFGEMQIHFSALAQAISSHCARACEKARSQNLVAQGIVLPYVAKINKLVEEKTQHQIHHTEL